MKDCSSLSALPTRVQACGRVAQVCRACVRVRKCAVGRSVVAACGVCRARVRRRASWSFIPRREKGVRNARLREGEIVNIVVIC